MFTVYNPLTGQWERLDDVVRPLPVIARDTRLVLVNDTNPFTPSFATSNAPGYTDLFGNSNGSRANIGIAVGSTDADIIIPDPWRIRRFIVMCNRGASGATAVNIACAVWGRLLAPDGTPTGWRLVASATDTINISVPARFGLPSSLAGAFGYDQYRIVFRRDPDSDPAPQITLVRLYVEF